MNLKNVFWMLFGAGFVNLVFYGISQGIFSVVTYSILGAMILCGAICSGIYFLAKETSFNLEKLIVLIITLCISLLYLMPTYNQFSLSEDEDAHMSLVAGYAMTVPTKDNLNGVVENKYLVENVLKNKEMPLDYTIRYWINHVAANSDFWVRIPSFIAFLVMIISFVFCLQKITTSFLLIAFGGLIFLTHPASVTYSQMIGPYTLTILFIFLQCIISWLILRERPTTGKFILLLSLSSLLLQTGGIFAFLFNVFFFVLLILINAFEKKQYYTIRSKQFSLSFWISLLFGVPYFYYQIKTFLVQGIGSVNSWDFVIDGFFKNAALPSNVFLLVLFVLFGVLGVFIFAKNKMEGLKEKRQDLILFSMIIFTILGIVFIKDIFLATTFYYYKYIFLAVPFVIIFIIYLINLAIERNSALNRAIVKVSFVILLCGTIFNVYYFYSYTIKSDYSYFEKNIDWKKIYSFLKINSKENDHAYFYHVNYPENLNKTQYSFVGKNFYLPKSQQSKYAQIFTVWDSHYGFYNSFTDALINQLFKVKRSDEIGNVYLFLYIDPAIDKDLLSIKFKEIKEKIEELNVEFYEFGPIEVLRREALDLRAIQNGLTAIKIVAGESIHYRVSLLINYLHVWLKDWPFSYETYKSVASLHALNGNSEEAYKVLGELEKISENNVSLNKIIAGYRDSLESFLASNVMFYPEGIFVVGEKNTLYYGDGKGGYCKIISKKQIEKMYKKGSELNKMGKIPQGLKDNGTCK